jgi:hypothetical protein
MSLLDEAKVPDELSSQVWCFYGESGVGKSTIASEFTTPLYIDLENSAKEICSRKKIRRLSLADVKSFDALKGLIKDLTEKPHAYKSVVIDSLTQLESMIESSLSGTESFAEMDSRTFKKGTKMVAEELHKFMFMLRKLQEEKDIDVVLVGHARPKKKTDAYTGDTYDRYLLACSEESAEKVKAFTNNLIFIKQEVQTHKDANSRKVVAHSDGSRVMYTEWRAGADAKNRLNLPYAIPFKKEAGYETLKKIILENKPKEAPELIADIKALMSRVTKDNAELISKKLEAAGDNVHQLMRLKTKALEVVTV